MRYRKVRENKFKETIIVDLDNTLMDALGELNSMYEWYTVDKQDYYCFERTWGKDKSYELLKHFHDRDFLTSMKYNQVVIDYLKNMKEYNILFVTKTKDENLDIRLDRILDELEEDITERIIGMITWQKDYKEALDKAKKLGATILVDDNPNNLIAAREEEIKTVKVLYPYNFVFKTDDVLLYSKDIKVRDRVKEELDEYLEKHNLIDLYDKTAEKVVEDFFLGEVTYKDLF